MSVINLETPLVHQHGWEVPEMLRMTEGFNVYNSMSTEQNQDCVIQLKALEQVLDGPLCLLLFPM